MRKPPIIKDISKRSKELEILDEENDFSSGEIDAIYENINQINKWLGGDKPTLNAIKRYIKKSKKEELFIIDIGSGGGGMCRNVSDLLTKLNVKHKIIGLDINDMSLDNARQRSKAYESVSFEKIDIFSKEFITLKPDIILSTLTFHHFSDEEIVKFLCNCFVENKPFVIINDLHRSKYAFYLFTLLTNVIRFNYINKVHGLISILRSFKRRDLERFDKKIKTTYIGLKSSIKWRFAFVVMDNRK